MALIPWGPFRDIDKFFGDEDWLPMIPIRPAKIPEADVYETDKEVVVEMSCAGVKPEDISISVEDNILNVKGKTSEEKEEKKKNFWRKEIKRGMFERILTLPTEVKGDKATAESANGMLKIILPKTEVKKVKKDQIKVKNK